MGCRIAGRMEQMERYLECVCIGVQMSMLNNVWTFSGCLMHFETTNFRGDTSVTLSQ